MELKSTCLMHVSPRAIECRPIELPPPSETQVIAQGLFSAISTGTERLIFEGKLEEDVSLDANLSSIQGESSAYPFPYGYCWTGRIEHVGQGVEDLAAGDMIFAFAPHQSRHVLEARDCIKIPATLTPQLATLLPTMETALSIVHDANPIAGEEIAVFGQGIVGKLTAWILNQFPLGSLRVIEPNIQQHQSCRDLGLENIHTAEQLKNITPADTCIEISGNPIGLRDAIAHTKANGKVIAASWYGTRTAELGLGTHFHRGRIQLISSQVSHLNPKLLGTWSKERRLQFAIDLLTRFPHTALETQSIPFSDCTHGYQDLMNSPQTSGHTYFHYGD